MISKEKRREYNQRYYKAHPEMLEYARQQNKKSYKRLCELKNRAKSKPCGDCGIQYPPYVMDFDHRDPSTKSFNIGEGLVWSRIALFEQEIAKCDVVCANCHRERTHKMFHLQGDPNERV